MASLDHGLPLKEHHQGRKDVTPPGGTAEELSFVCVAPGGSPLPPRHLCQAQWLSAPPHPGTQG